MSILKSVALTMPGPNFSSISSLIVEGLPAALLSGTLEVGSRDAPMRPAFLREGGRAGSRDRTDDLLITNQLLYQLSYAGTSKRARSYTGRTLAAN